MLGDAQYPEQGFNDVVALLKRLPYFPAFSSSMM
jgi:hypothetical protein